MDQQATVKLVRIYMDIDSALEQAMRVQCAEQRITRKQYVEDLIRANVRTKGAIVRAASTSRRSKKG